MFLYVVILLHTLAPNIKKLIGPVNLLLYILLIIQKIYYTGCPPPPKKKAEQLIFSTLRATL